MTATHSHTVCCCLQSVVFSTHRTAPLVLSSRRRKLTVSFQQLRAEQHIDQKISWCTQKCMSGIAPLYFLGCGQCCAPSRTLHSLVVTPTHSIHILDDFSPTSNASALVAQLQLKNLQSRRTSDKVCRMYKIMNGLVDVKPTAGLLEPRNCSSRGHKYQLHYPRSKTDLYPHSYFPSAFRLWNSVPTGAPSAVTLPAFRSALTGWMEGQV